jgi:hypothetical protein
MLSLLGFVDMLIGSLILCLLRKKEQRNFVFALIVEISIKQLLKMNTLCLADFLVNFASGHRVLSFLDGNAG